MTSNALMSAILVDAIAAIAPRFDSECHTPKTETRTFTVSYVEHSLGHRTGPGTGEIRIHDDAMQIEIFRGESPCFADALEELRGEDREQTRSKAACTSIDRDGDELITVFGSRSLGDATPGFDRGTYAVLGGTGKFKGFSVIGAYACAFAQSPGAGFAATFSMEVMHKMHRGDADCVAFGTAYSPIAA